MVSTEPKNSYYFNWAWETDFGGVRIWKSPVSHLTSARTTSIRADRAPSVLVPKDFSLTCHHRGAIVLNLATNTVITIHTTTDKVWKSLTYMSSTIYPPVDLNTSLPVAYQESDNLIP